MIAWKGTNVILIGAREGSDTVNGRGQKLEQASTRCLVLAGKWIKISILQAIDILRGGASSGSMSYRGQWTRRLAASQRNINACIDSDRKTVDFFFVFYDSFPGFLGLRLGFMGREFSHDARFRGRRNFVSDFIVVQRNIEEGTREEKPSRRATWRMI